jgi:hypothetical protein
MPSREPNELEQAKRMKSIETWSRSMKGGVSLRIGCLMPPLALGGDCYPKSTLQAESKTPKRSRSMTKCTNCMMTDPRSEDLDIGRVLASE